jgi:hypothetical protein
MVMCKVGENETLNMSLELVKSFIVNPIPWRLIPSQTTILAQGPVII